MRQEMLIQYITEDDQPGESICDTKAQVMLLLNQMPEPKGLMSIRFLKTGTIKTGTRATLVKAGRNGTLFQEDIE